MLFLDDYPAYLSSGDESKKGECNNKPSNRLIKNKKGKKKKLSPNVLDERITDKRLKKKAIDPKYNTRAKSLKK